MYTIVLTDEEFDFVKKIFCKVAATPDLSKADDAVQAHALAVMAGSIDLRKNKIPTTDTVDESPQIKTTVLVSSKYYKDTILKIQELFTVLEPLITWGAISKGNLERLRARVLDISITK